MSSAAVEHAAVEGGTTPASEEEKNPAGEKDTKSSSEGGDIHINLKGKEQAEIDPGDEKSCNDDKTIVPIDAEEPASEGGSAVINKGQIVLSEAEKTQVIVDAEKPHLSGLLAVLEEGDASKKEKKRKRELVKIKKEHQEGTLLSKAEKKRWRVELVKIKEEHQQGGGEITWRWHAFYSTRLHYRRMTKLYGSILQQAEVNRQRNSSGWLLPQGRRIGPSGISL